MSLLKVLFSMKVVCLLLLLVESIEVGYDEPYVNWKEALREHRRIGRARLTQEFLERHNYARRRKLKELLASNTVSEATKRMIRAELNESEEDQARAHQEQLQHLATDVFDHLDWDLQVS